MRVDKTILDSFCEIIEQSIDLSKGSELFLFGSRVDPKKKGGDIDLLLVTDEYTKLKMNELRLYLKALLREAAGDQKVDLSVATHEQKKSDPFFSSIDELVSLRKW